MTVDDELRQSIYPVRTVQELESIALGLFEGKIFSHLQMDDNVHLAHVFIPLVYLTPEQHSFLVREPPGLIYEYLDRAEKNVATIWKYPVFLSCNLLSKEQAEEVYQIYDCLIKKHTTRYVPDDQEHSIDSDRDFESEYIFPE
jgi:hypothetical protein